jgi:CRP-like cAMP-binding protein
MGKSSQSHLLGDAAMSGSVLSNIDGTHVKVPKGSKSGALEKFLARLSLRSRLSDEEQQAILALDGREVFTDAHRDIVRPGQTIDFACLVVDGLAGRFDQLANGHRQITALHIPGDMCDLHSVAVPHTGWGIEALTGTNCLRVPHKSLRELTVKYPAIAYAFWRDTIADSSVLAKWLSALGRRSAKLRMAHLACEMGIRMEQAGLGERNCYRLPATQAQLADVLGVTTVHLNRTFQTLRREGLLLTERAIMKVPDFERLCAVAEFDHRYLLLDPSER